MLLFKLAKGRTALAKEGDKQALQNLVLRHQVFVYNLALKMVRNIEDAEDLAQMVQIRVSERLPQLRQTAAFPVWVRRVIHHVALDMLRQRRPLFSLDDLTESTHEIAAEPEGTDPYDLALLRTFSLGEPW